MGIRQLVCRTLVNVSNLPILELKECLSYVQCREYVRLVLGSN